jgi:hypothetical protein
MIPVATCEKDEDVVDVSLRLAILPEIESPTPGQTNRIQNYNVMLCNQSHKNKPNKQTKNYKSQMQSNKVTITNKLKPNEMANEETQKQTSKQTRQTNKQGSILSPTSVSLNQCILPFSIVLFSSKQVKSFNRTH